MRQEWVREAAQLQLAFVSALPLKSCDHRSYKNAPLGGRLNSEMHTLDWMMSAINQLYLIFKTSLMLGAEN